MTRRPLAVAASALALLAAGCGGTGPDRAASPGATPTAAVTSAAPEFTRPSVQPAALVARFGYDAKAPLRVTSVRTATKGDATVTTIRYDVAGGPPVEAEVVAPRTAKPGRHPGVVLAHGGAPGPTIFEAEAIGLAAHGYVSILPDIPMTITGDAGTDVSFVTRAVVAERRALDYLVSRRDVDPARLAFVGHSWGADLAAIMAGVDRRLRAVVVACARDRIDLDMDTMGAPADRNAYLAAASVLDGDRFVALAAPRRVLFQWGRQDGSIPLGERNDLLAATSGAKDREDYDFGHDLVDFPPATADRVAFLVGVLR